MELALLLALIVLNGVFAMSEIALVTARKARLRRLADGGDGSAAIALALADEPTRLLSTVQIGITSIGVLNGIVGEALIAAPLAGWLQGFGVGAQAAHFGATAIVVLVITYASIVVGELVPKRVGQLHPETVARLVARPMRVLAAASRPFVLLLSASTDLLVRLLGLSGEPQPEVTAEEIHEMLEQGSAAGVIERSEHAMVRNVFRLDERRIGSLMVPKSEIVYLDRQAPLAHSLDTVAASAHSRFPVCDGGLDNVVGILHTRQLLAQALAGERPSLDVELQPPLYVPETLTGMELLDNFRSSSTATALVVDEYGQLQGLVTLHDLLEAIAGEMPGGQDGESWAIPREDGSWLLDGLLPVPELKDTLAITAVPDEARGHYNSLAGMLMLLLGRVPATGDTATWEGWRFEVIDTDDRRVDKVLATPIALAPAVAATDAGSAPPGDPAALGETAAARDSAATGDCAPSADPAPTADPAPAADPVPPAAPGDSHPPPAGTRGG